MNVVNIWTVCYVPECLWQFAQNNILEWPSRFKFLSDYCWQRMGVTPLSLVTM